MDGPGQQQMDMNGKVQQGFPQGGAFNLEEVLAQHESVYIQQKASLLEAFSAGCCEVNNVYTVHSQSVTGPLLFTVKEDSKFCLRCCCAPGHSFKLNVAPPQQPDNIVYTFTRAGCCDKPCLCCCPFGAACQDEMILHQGHVTGDEGKFVGANPVALARQASVGQSCCKPQIDSFQPGGTEAELRITGPCCFGGCSELCFDSHFMAVNLKSEETIGEVKKLRPATCMDAIKEMATDSDRFQIDFQKANNQQKMGLLTSAFLSDFMFFEQDNGMCRRTAGGQIAITCFQCYVCGMLCPCGISCGGSGGGGGSE